MITENKKTKKIKIGMKVISFNHDGTKRIGEIVKINPSEMIDIKFEDGTILYSIYPNSFKNSGVRFEVASEHFTKIATKLRDRYHTDLSVDEVKKIMLKADKDWAEYE